MWVTGASLDSRFMGDLVDSGFQISSTCRLRAAFFHAKRSKAFLILRGLNTIAMEN